MPTWKQVAPGIYTHKKPGKFYERSTIQGRRTFKVLASDSLKDAKEELAEVRTRRKRIERGLDLPENDKSNWPVADVLERYKQANCPDRDLHRRPERSESEEIRRVDVLLRFFRAQRVKELNKEMCAEYGAWRMRNIQRAGMSGRRAADHELVTLSNALDFSHISTEPIRNRKNFYKPSQARKCRDCAPESGDELHEIARLIFRGNVRGHSAGWQMLFEAFTGVRTNEALLWRMDAKMRGHRGEPGFIQGKWLWLHRSKKGVNPYVVIEGRPELQALIEAHREWHEAVYPDSPWYFPNSKDQMRPVDKKALVRKLSRLLESGEVKKKFTSHGMRAFYVLVRRSQGIADGQISAEIGDRTTSLIETTYGAIPANWQGGADISFMPTKGEPAWKYVKAPSKQLKRFRDAA